MSHVLQTTTTTQKRTLILVIPCLLHLHHALLLLQHGLRSGRVFEFPVETVSVIAARECVGSSCG